MTTNDQQALWLQRMERIVANDGEEDGHLAADEILLQIAEATGHGAIAGAYRRIPTMWYS